MFRYTFLFILLIALLAWFIFFPIKTSVNHKGITPSPVDDITYLRFGHNTPIDSALHEAAVRFAAEIKRKSKGKVQIAIFPSQQLGNDHKMVEMARNGELDILLTPTAKMSVPIPSMQYADLPFYFPSREDLYMMLDGEPGKILLNKLDTIGLVGITFWENGFKHFTGNSPLISPEDFRNKKIRVMKSRIIMEQFKAFDAEPVPIDFHSTRQALADNVVDGQENPLIAIVSMGFYQVQSDLTLSEHAYLGYVLSISKKIFEKLPQKVKLMLIDTAKEITPWERQETQRREKKLIETIRRSGVAIHQLSDENRQKFANKTASIAKKYENIIGADLISKTEELLLIKYGPDPKKQEQIVIGINAAISGPGQASGLAIKRGAELAINEINSKGGVLGKPLKLIVRDHRFSPSIGKSNIEHFTNRDDIVAVIGGKHSAIIINEIKLIQQNKIPYLVPWAAIAEIIENNFQDNYLFRVSANDRIAARFIAAYALKHNKKPAIIVENSPWGRNNLTRMSAYLSEQGIKPATSIIYNLGQKSYLKELKEIKKSSADSIIMVANTKEGTILVEEMIKQGSTLPIISHWGITGGTFFKENKGILDKINLHFLQTFSFTKSKRLPASQLQYSYQQYYDCCFDGEIEAPSGVAQTYDLVHLLAIAIEKAGTTDRTKVKETLENLPSHEGALKFYSPAFTKDRHDALDQNDFFMAMFDLDGRIVPATN